MPEKISHINADELQNDNDKRTTFELPNGGGRIFSYHPFKSMQLIFFDVHTSDLPDMWELGFRKGDNGRYLRTLICKQGSCDFTVNGKINTLPAGQVMMDYSVGDDKKFTFTTEEFIGVEITMQVDTLVEENSMMKMLRIVIESMGLPEEEIFDADGYLFNYSKSTAQTLDKLMEAAAEDKAGIILMALVVEIGHSLGVDLKKKDELGDKMNERGKAIAYDIYRSLTEEYGKRWTAKMFAEKYGVSDTTVKNRFKKTYGYGFKEYQTKVRMERAAKLLETTNDKISDISASIGYPNQTKFSKTFKKYYDTTPLHYRQSARRKDNS